MRFLPALSVYNQSIHYTPISPSFNFKIEIIVATEKVITFFFRYVRNCLTFIAPPIKDMIKPRSKHSFSGNEQFKELIPLNILNALHAQQVIVERDGNVFWIPCYVYVFSIGVGRRTTGHHVIRQVTCKSAGRRQCLIKEKMK